MLPEKPLGGLKGFACSIILLQMYSQKIQDFIFFAVKSHLNCEPILRQDLDEWKEHHYSYMQMKLWH